MFPFDDVIMVNEMKHGAVTVTLPWHSGNIRQVILQWRHNEPYDISNHQHIDCLLKRLFWGTLKKTSKLRVTGLYEGNPPFTGGFPWQWATNPKNVAFDDVIINHSFIWLVLSIQLKQFNTYLSTRKHAWCFNHSALKASVATTSIVCFIVYCSFSHYVTIGTIFLNAYDTITATAAN